MNLGRRDLLLALGSLAGAGGLVALLRNGGYAPKPRIAAGTSRDPEEYGTLRRQRGEWWLPAEAAAGRPLPTVVLVHGGFWRAGYDLGLEDAVAADLAGRGYLVWNVDYRPSADPWRATLDDVSAGYAWLSKGRHAKLVDRSRLAVVGHSAGGHLALWLGSQRKAALRPALVVAQAPVAALAVGAAEGLGGGAVEALLGGPPAAVPERYAEADPIGLLPTGVRAVLVHGRSDDTVPISQSERYLAAATAAGDACTLEPYDGGHFEHLDPTSDACALMRRALESM